MTSKTEARIAARLQKHPEFSRAWHAWKNEADPEKKDKIRVAMVRRFGEPFVSGTKLRAGFTRRGRGVVQPAPVELMRWPARGAKAARCLEEAEARLAWGCNYVLPESEMVAADDVKVSRTARDFAEFETRLMGTMDEETKRKVAAAYEKLPDSLKMDMSTKEVKFVHGGRIKFESSNQLVKVADGVYVSVPDEGSASLPIDFSGIEPQAAIAYTVSEAATELGISPSSVRSRLAAGSLKGEKDQAGKWTVFGPLA